MKSSNRYAQQFKASRDGAKAEFENDRQILKAIQANMFKAERDLALLREKMKQGNWIACSAYCRTLSQIFAGGGGSLESLFDEYRAAGGSVIPVRNSKEGTKAEFDHWQILNRRAAMRGMFGVSRPINYIHTESNGGVWKTKTERYGSKKATVEFYNKGGLVGSVYQDPDNPRMYKAFSESDDREIASGSREACKAAVERLAMSRPGAKAEFAWIIRDAGEAKKMTEYFYERISRMDPSDDTSRSAAQTHLNSLLSALDEAVAEGSITMAESQARKIHALAAYRSVFSRLGAKAKFGLERELSLVLNRAGIDHDWDGGELFIVASDIERAKQLIDRSGVVKPDKLNKVLGNIQKMQRGHAFSRSGAKAQFGNADRLDNLLAATYRALRNNDKAAARKLLSDAAKEIDSNTPVNLVADFKELKASMSRPGEADAFALGAASEATRPEQDEALIALAAKVGREHTVSLFKRWSEGKASMSRQPEQV